MSTISKVSLYMIIYVTEGLVLANGQWGGARLNAEDAV